MMTTKQILVAARFRLAGSWQQGDYGVLGRGVRQGAPVCIAGAVNWASSGSPFTRKPNADAAFKVLDDLCVKWGGYVGFNDHPSTAEADVLKVFDDAIAAARFL